MLVTKREFCDERSALEGRLIISALSNGLPWRIPVLALTECRDSKTDPISPRDNGWWVVDGVTETGARLDPLTGRVPTMEKPADLASRYDRYWRKYFSNIRIRTNEAYRPGLAGYITRVNQRTFPPGQRLQAFQLIYVRH